MSTQQMVINYVPGEECRVAIVEEGRLEEFHAERMDGPSSHVGNIYVGKVVNVEPAIQAAFIDFGLEHNGFLHISDVHPQYFPGEDAESTERVGKKTPRRDRPPIQECFRRGDEVAVQVLKEGVGTKGPTVTSYLSIPGRFLVMMPQMDKVGVSRKVEDEEQRRKMREILDQLDLPDGFGFILRTAGMERTKAELKRDLAYLQRLWKDMEKRWRSGSKPRLLYSESDLLVRALRDMLTADIAEVVVDNQAALNRAARFLKIVAPRTTTRIVHFTGKAPVFHVLGIEPQIQMIHAREVPLESGGRLVIDEAEALVAIDVNSGKSRDARDAETNAYRTNMEACNEICRQLRLRDIGGVIVNDLIDMRQLKHRREVETLFRELLKKDRARWTIAPISEFGILEMTRQRMRGSHESQHFADCPTCRGRGLVQRPDSVAADGLRELAALLDAERVYRVELVVHPRIAGELLSHQRRALTRLERTSNKHVDVRVSDAIAVDRLTFYAYDDRGADIDLASIARPTPRPDEFQEYSIARDATEAEENWAEELAPTEGQDPEAGEAEAAESEAELHPIEFEPGSLDQFEDGRAPVEEQGQARGPIQGQGHAEQDDGERGPDGRRRRRRRGRRGGRGRTDNGPGFEGAPNGAPNADGGYDQNYGDQPPANGGSTEAGDSGVLEAGAPTDGHEVHAGPGYSDDRGGHEPGAGDGQPHEQGAGEGDVRRRRRRRRGRRGRGGPGESGGMGGPMGEPGQAYGPGEHAAGGSEGQYDQGAYGGPGYAGEQHAPVEGEYQPETGYGDRQPGEGYAPGDEPYAPGAHAGSGEHAGHGAPYPDGPGGPGGEVGPDGVRRRRRRRGGRGRNRGGAGGQSGPGGQGGPGPHGDGYPAPAQGDAGYGGNYEGAYEGNGAYAPTDRGAPYGQENVPPNDDSHTYNEQRAAYAQPESEYAPQAEGSAGEGNFDGGEPLNAEFAPPEGADTRPGPDGPESPEGGPRRRRRRGRGGRGGAGEGRGGAPGEGSANDARSASPSPAARGDRSRDQRSGRSSGEGRGQPPAKPVPAKAVPAKPERAIAPKPASPAKPAAGPAAKPRTLYSSRRRLGPAGIKGIKRED